jgi:hypothetical protein
VRDELRTQPQYFHSAGVYKEQLILFGGLVVKENNEKASNSNDIILLSLGMLNTHTFVLLQLILLLFFPAHVQPNPLLATPDFILENIFQYLIACYLSPSPSLFLFFSFLIQ